MDRDKLTEDKRLYRRLLFSVVLASISIITATIAATSAVASQAADAQTPTPAKLVTYGPFTLPGEFKDLKVIIKTDIGIIAPELQNYARDDSQLLSALRLGSSGAEVVKQTGWGHIVPYAYAATYHFLGRLFYGISTSTPLLPKSYKKNVTFTLLLISDMQLFQQRAAAAGHGVGVGYWDSKHQEAGIHIKQAMFRWAGYQAQWKGRQPAIDIQALERYVARTTMREIGHELFHAVQTFTDSRFYHFPLMTEATALLAQHNAFDREESSVLVAHQMQLNVSSDIHQKSAEECSDDSFKEAWPGDFFSMRKLQQAYKATMHKKGFSLTKLLLCDEVEFYGVSKSELQDRYSIALSVIYFLRSLRAETTRDWEAVLQEAYEKDDIAVSRKAAHRVDAAYVEWMEQLSNRWWRSGGAIEKYKNALNRQTECLNETNLIAARLWAVAACAYMPDSPAPALYLGDVFYRAGEPFAALDYYKLAESLGDPTVFGEYPSRIKSRIGDALEQLGDIEGAMSLYKSMLGQKAESPQLMFTFARTSLKYEYYRLTEASGRWRTEEHRVALNQYIKALQAGETAKAAREREMAGDVKGYVEAVMAQYRVVLEQMHRDLDQH